MAYEKEQLRDKDEGLHDWRQSTIGEEATLQRGFDITRRQMKSGRVPVISSGGIVGYHDRPMNKGPGVVIGRKGTLGNVFFMEDDFWAHDTTLWVKDFHGNDPKFIHYFFKSFDVKYLDVGSANPTLNRNHVHPIPMAVPPLPEQQAIAHILGTLDDKIELNRRMNETLESLARAIFKSWFVDFEPIPGIGPHEGWEDSSVGRIPKGWRMGTLEGIVEILDFKRIPLSKKERESRKGKYPYYGAASIVDYVDDYLFDGVYVLMGEDGTVIDKDGFPIVQYVWGKFWVNNHAHVLQGKDGIPTEFVSLLLKSSRVNHLVTGAVQPKINQGNMKSLVAVIPYKAALDKFAEIVEPMFGLIRSNTDQAQTLCRIRDTLLPKLLSGELRIKDAEIFVSKAV